MKNRILIIGILIGVTALAMDADEATRLSIKNRKILVEQEVEACSERLEEDLVKNVALGNCTAYVRCRFTEAQEIVANRFKKRKFRTRLNDNYSITIQWE